VSLYKDVREYLRFTEGENSNIKSKLSKEGVVTPECIEDIETLINDIEKNEGKEILLTELAKSTGRESIPGSLEDVVDNLKKVRDENLSISSKKNLLDENSKILEEEIKLLEQSSTIPTSLKEDDYDV
jgi:uncharacterized protein YllA (UPF0747 family)